MGLEISSFGHLPSGEEVHLFKFSNESGIEISITNYGGIITSIITPDKNGDFSNIVLGFDNLSSYLEEHPYIGVLIGRNANRISQAQYTYNGKKYHLTKNENAHQLHGGKQGLDKILWNYDISNIADRQVLILKHNSPNDTEGFPGLLECQVTFELKDDDTFEIGYRARTDFPTPVNFTHHDYFNLLDGGVSSMTDHLLKINASNYTPVGPDKIPTGEIASVENSAYDFRSFQSLGSMMLQKDGKIEFGSGYDDNFVIDKKEVGIAHACTLRDPISRRQLEIWSTQPCLQLYTGSFLDGSYSRNGHAFNHHHGVCLESQAYVDAVNQKNFPTTIVLPDDVYQEKTVYKFSCY